MHASLSHAGQGRTSPPVARPFRFVAAALGLALSMASMPGAVAQVIDGQPSRSRSEREVQDLNRSMGQNLRMQQNNQQIQQQFNQQQMQMQRLQNQNMPGMLRPCTTGVC